MPKKHAARIAEPSKLGTIHRDGKAEFIGELETNASLVRREVFEGREHLVAPVVMLVEGVHRNLYYPSNEISIAPDLWNGIPVTINHPMERGVPISATDPKVIETSAVGRIFNTHWDGKLRAEAWIDLAKAMEKAPEVLRVINEGGKLEVSTGLYTDADGIPGVWNQESYSATVSNYHPNHLALLPGGQGACNWADGCGIRLNQTAEGALLDPEKGVNVSSKFNLLTILATSEQTEVLRKAAVEGGFRMNEESFDDIREALQRAIQQLDSAIWFHRVEEVFASDFVYEACENAPSPIGGGKEIYFRRSYKMDDATGEAILGDDAREVEEVKSWVPSQASGAYGAPTVMTAGAVVRAGQEEESKPMDRNEAITKLIECECSRFVANDRPFLETLTEDQLKAALELPAVEPPKKEEPKPAEPVVSDHKIEFKPPVQPTALTADEYVAQAPAAVAGVLRRALAREQAEKDALVGALVANQRNRFPEEALRQKDIEELKALTDLAAITVNYAGQAGAAAQRPPSGPPPMPAVFEIKS